MAQCQFVMLALFWIVEALGDVLGTKKDVQNLSNAPRSAHRRGREPERSLSGGHRFFAFLDVQNLRFEAYGPSKRPNTEQKRKRVSKTEHLWRLLGEEARREAQPQSWSLPVAPTHAGGGGVCCDGHYRRSERPAGKEVGHRSSVRRRASLLILRLCS